MSEKPLFFTVRVGDKKPYPDSVIRVCSKCQNQVWVKRNLVHLADVSDILCIECIMAHPNRN